MKKLLLYPVIVMLTLEAAAQKWTKEYEFVNEVFCGLSLVEKNGKQGYVNKDGKVIIPLTFDEGMNFSEDRAAVRKEGKWGFIDTAGKEITKIQYTEVYSFSEGKAVVAVGESFGFIDTAGALVIPMRFSRVFL
jgi:hypothetical protein